MPSVTSREFQKNVGQYQDMALRRAVTVTKHGREHVVILAAEEYRRLKELDRRALLAEELPDEIIDAIEKSEVPPEHQHLDAELEG
ncbi:MAG: type II toxin-antitoxin system Phd/YefM family antitoxin [Alphaproteobacteria bacterium]|nr:type II toxin-antitoxin system Phd/YefM family antitoxin [Alphaproteobacteria bacterium]MCK5621853.1 type II toxin-antitoxin system Phd/YefM family antitoxin [Alphaproteobacteria bacterium]